jgi:uncharacterized membrane protein (DUF373 family)
VRPWLHVGEVLILVGVTVVLVLSGIVVVADAFFNLFVGLTTYAPETGGVIIFDVIETALLALILAELVSTLLVTLDGSALRPEPFVVIGLVAIVRKLLLATSPGYKSAADGYPISAQGMELLVLTLLVLLLGITLAVLRLSGRRPENRDQP